MSPATPQQKGVVESVFHTIYSKMRTMMMHARLHKNLKNSLWPECAAIVTKLEKIMVNPHEEKSAHEMFYKKKSDYAKYLTLFLIMVPYWHHAFLFLLNGDKSAPIRISHRKI